MVMEPKILITKYEDINQKIPMDIANKLIAFYNHLNAADVNRTIFSVKLGERNSEFIERFKEKYSNQYAFYTLTPINYEVAMNEQILEYVKRDLLFQLILDGTLNTNIKIPDHILLQWYFNENTIDVVKDIMRFAPSTLSNGNQLGMLLKGTITLAEGYAQQCKKFRGLKENIARAKFERAAKSIAKMSAATDEIGEIDPMSWLITHAIMGLKKTPVLLIEDFDRIDPVQLFGIFNIFSTRTEKKTTANATEKQGDDNEINPIKTQNKFGFAKIIFMMDTVAIGTIFRNYYGEANYESYIKEFVARTTFYHSVSEHAKSSLQSYVKEECKINFETVSKGLTAIGIRLDRSDIKDMMNVLDNFEDAYIREEVSVTDNFRFQSDTPLVKLLTLLKRIGVKEHQLSDFFSAIEAEENFMDLLGCFAVTKESILRHGKVCHRGVLYQMVVDEEEGTYKTFDRVMTIPSMVSVDDYRFLEVDIDKVIRKALEYVRRI